MTRVEAFRCEILPLSNWLFEAFFRRVVGAQGCAPESPAYATPSGAPTSQYTNVLVTYGLAQGPPHLSRPAVPRVLAAPGAGGDA